MKATIYLAWRKYRFDSKFSLSATDFKLEPSESVAVVQIGTRDIDIDVDAPTEHEALIAEIEQLELIRSKLVNDNHDKLADIDKRINGLTDNGDLVA